MAEKVVIMAGGKGSRIASVRSDVPKPMIEVGGKPVLEHIIMCAQKQGFTDFIISIGHLSDVISNYFGDGSNGASASSTAMRRGRWGAAAH